MRTSTFLAVLAALMLLVACAAPVFGQSSSSSSSTGAASSSSSATIIASSSSTGTSTNNNTVASSSAASASSSSASNGVVELQFVSITFPIDFTTFLSNVTQAADYTAEVPIEVAQALGIQSSQTYISKFTPGSTVASVGIKNLAANVNAASTIQAQAANFRLLKTASAFNAGEAQTGSASTLSFGFAAVAVVFAALLQ